ncbi:hypothetical protein FA09DRAFT_40605 [Tilletiopsis washingtonensis]|uniref:Uncharacterized protein n=1 Tax=Tilletiopsis washingtonensis TaxID=58919 RepID=A0A316Z9D6_9BASI|nr:hypothetical protein FA09DRAFT_40605 [Tilletiopsis washingtonensis]PWN97598.1 hypothetical protein FA09DRAFT_40605 [Tilletiopsis washingtonensis]
MVHHRRATRRYRDSRATEGRGETTLGRSTRDDARAGTRMRSEAGPRAGSTLRLVPALKCRCARARSTLAQRRAWTRIGNDGRVRRRRGSDADEVQRRLAPQPGFPAPLPLEEHARGRARSRSIGHALHQLAGKKADWNAACPGNGVQIPPFRP